MRRGAKPGKPKAEARKNADSRVRDLEKRLAEALQREAEAQKREAEAREQRTATAEILRVISTSPSDVQPVFDAIVRNAVRLCDGVFSNVLRFDGEIVHFGAQHNFSPDALAAYRRWFPRRAADDRLVGRALLERRVMNVPDVTSEFRFVPAQQEQGFRSILFVPMVRDGVSIGVIGVSRMVVGPFPESQVELLQTFADQAVVAIENVRLFNETKEALEQQTAMAEILRVISSSPTDIQPVLDTVAECAARLCAAQDTSIFRRDGDRLLLVAHHGPIDFGLVGEAFLPLVRGTANGRSVLDGRTVHLADLQAEVDEFPEGSETARRFGHRTVLNVPLMRDGVAIGSISVRRTEVHLFTDQQVGLLQTFADQAVIAIENVRLFTELQEKNGALTLAHAQVSESLEQQTATSEILRTIAHAQTDVQPVFDTIVRSAARLCHAVMASVLLTDGRTLYLPANCGSSPEALTTVRARFPRPLDPETVSGAAILTRSVIHVPDVLEPSVVEFTRQAGQLLGYRSLATVPMLREGTAIGAINVCRREPGRFSDAEVELLKTFADQAVIAVENVRLFKELQARTTELTQSVEQLTALGEVGRAVSSTLDLETVLTTIVSRAVQLSGLDGGVVFEYDEAAEEFVHRAATETGGTLAEARRTARIRKGEGVVGQTAITLEPVQVPDIAVPGSYDSRLRENLIESGVRAILAVPMVREGRLLGCLVVSRNHPGEYPAETIELLRTFATQSALAIQNARLFQEIADKSAQLEAASRHKSEFLANMSHELRTPLNAIIGFSEVLTERMFGELNEKQDEYLRDIYASGQHLLSLINDILDLSKIEAGRMELEATDFDVPSAIDNALTLVRERATRRGITLGRTIDERLGRLQGDERKVKQVLLNLLSNALKFTPEGGRIDVSARLQDGAAEIAVADTGVGIAPEDQEAVFQEFRQVGTADKKVEGTGLGLALSRKFIELHGGRIRVQSQVGHGSTFTFTLPVRRDE
jgi:two-component system, NtrC family, sensor kinase